MIDINKIKTFYKLSRALNWSDIQTIVKAAKSKTYKPNEYLFEEGSYNRDIFLIRKGIIRTFKVNKKGEEITTSIRAENQIIANVDHIFFDLPSSNYLQSIETTEVLYMNFDALEEIVKKHPKLVANRKFVLRKLLKESYRRVETFVMLSPEERYLDFIENNNDIANRVPDKYIANVLGITPVSLSRIRKRIAEKRIKKH
jgi:CRP-like cAMP-binding protein